MTTLREYGVRDGFIPSNDNKPKPVSEYAAFLNMVKERAGTSSQNQNERFQITWFDDVDQSTAKEEIVQGVLPPATYEALMGAPSMGQFYNQNIKGSGSDGPYDCRTHRVPDY